MGTSKIDLDDLRMTMVPRGGSDVTEFVVSAYLPGRTLKA
jgi:hypothetical protein